MLWNQQTVTTGAPAELTAIILDIANYKLFRPMRSDVPAEKPKHFMKINFFKKAVYYIIICY